MGIPGRQGQPADSDDGRIRVRLREELQPAGIRYRVIVEEGHDVTTRHRDPCVPSARQPGRLLVLHYRQVGQRRCQPTMKSRIVVGHHYDLGRSPALPPDGIHCCDDVG